MVTKKEEQYDLQKLSQVLPELKKYLITNQYGNLSVDFSNPDSVRTLNKAILLDQYGIHWSVPSEFLCPPVPGRADYIHHLKEISPEKAHKILDVGTGANCIYPIIGVSEYDWDFVGSDINREAISIAQRIVSENKKLKNKIELRLQSESSNIFKNIIKQNEYFTFTMCNPPFHASLKEAQSGTQRKWRNLGKNLKDNKKLNFGGVGAELWTPGGEKKFLLQMTRESVLFATQVEWFTTLVSKSENLPSLEAELNKIQIKESKIVTMKRGNKISRILAWKF